MVVPSAAVVGLPRRPAPTATLKPAGNRTLADEPETPFGPERPDRERDERRADPDLARRLAARIGQHEAEPDRGRAAAPEALRETDRDKRGRGGPGSHRDAGLRPVLGRAEAGRPGQDGEVRAVVDVAGRDRLRGPVRHAADRPSPGPGAAPAGRRSGRSRPGSGGGRRRRPVTTQPVTLRTGTASAAAATSRRAARPGTTHDQRLTTRAARACGRRSARGAPRCAGGGATDPGSARRSRASRPPRAAGCRRSPAIGRAPDRARRGRGVRSGISLLSVGRPSSASENFDERELVVPAEERPIRLAESVADRRREVDPGDQPDGGVEDDRDPDVEPASPVELEVPGRHTVALDAIGRRQARARRTSLRHPTGETTFGSGSGPASPGRAADRAATSGAFGDMAGTV